MIVELKWQCLCGSNQSQHVEVLNSVLAVNSFCAHCGGLYCTPLTRCKVLLEPPVIPGTIFTDIIEGYAYCHECKQKIGEGQCYYENEENTDIVHCVPCGIKSSPSKVVWLEGETAFGMLQDPAMQYTRAVIELKSKDELESDLEKKKNEFHTLSNNEFVKRYEGLKIQIIMLEAEIYKRLV